MTWERSLHWNGPWLAVPEARVPMRIVRGYAAWSARNGDAMPAYRYYYRRIK